MRKVLVTVTFEYEVDASCNLDEKLETDIVEEAVKKARREINALTLTVHEVKVEIA